MKNLEKIKEHITAIIRKEERKTQSEMEELHGPLRHRRPLPAL
jgi:hypothetical protein